MGRERYSEEVKEQTARYVLESGKSAIKVSEELGININTVLDLCNKEVIGYAISSKKYKAMLLANGITGSMSSPGCQYDNSCVESFFASMKKELIYRNKYDTLEDVQRDAFKYIELFYNRTQLHSSLGYKSPVSYRLSLQAA